MLWFKLVMHTQFKYRSDNATSNTVYEFVLRNKYQIQLHAIWVVELCLVESIPAIWIE